MKKTILIIILTASAICYGTNEIRAYYASGSTLYAVLRNATGQAFDTVGNAFEAWNVMTDYDIVLTDCNGGMYTGTFDADTPAGLYTIMVYKQMGANPADSDPPIQFEEGYWTGTVWKSSRDRLEDINTAVPTVEEIRIEIDANSTQFAAIVEDTGTTLPSTLSGMNTKLDTIDNYVDTEIALILEDTGTTIPELIDDVNIPDIDTDLETIKTGIEYIINKIARRFIQIYGE